jgi:hypothetical protein
MYGRWRDDDRFRDDRDRDAERRRMREREFGPYDQPYDQDRYGYGRQDRYRYGRGGDYERGDYGRDYGRDYYDRGRDYDYGRGGGFERERRYGDERGYRRGEGWRADEHPVYARNAYRPEPRSFRERGRDEAGSWFGDEDAMRRRQQDDIREGERERWGARRDEDRFRREPVRGDWRDRDFDRDRGGIRDQRERRFDEREDSWRRDAGERWERDWDWRGSNRDW